MKKTNKEGMRYPSIDELVNKTDTFTREDGSVHAKQHTKYQLAYIAAKRGHLIEEDERRKEKLLTNHSDDDIFAEAELNREEENDRQNLCVKPVGIALEEYLRGELHCSFKSNDLSVKKAEEKLEQEIAQEDTTSNEENK
ncbi:MAG: DNA-directed RNA polymerase subunit omega [Acholeplasmatales bacterium]|nr:DNA-directed RNA polymerase subunit omega [Acholeplasmatales bacterium]